jgi:hypothetical protein
VQHAAPLRRDLMIARMSMPFTIDPESSHCTIELKGDKDGAQSVRRVRCNTLSIHEIGLLHGAEADHSGTDFSSLTRILSGDVKSPRMRRKNA